MPKAPNTSQFTVKGTLYQSDQVAKSLAYLSSERTVEFFQETGLNVPRSLRIEALQEVLVEPVKTTIKERKGLADEVGYKLTFFKEFTESQLVNLLEFYNDSALSRAYLELLWTSLIDYVVEKRTASDNTLETLFLDASKAHKNGVLPATKSFNIAIDSYFFDQVAEIDGVSQERFRYVTYKASTLTELRQIGSKFNAPVPKRLRKNEVLDIVLTKLKERETLTQELEEKLKKYNILLLERYAKDNDIKVSTELKKEEIIEFILANAKETKETYVKPVTESVYEYEPEPLVEDDSTPEVPEEVTEEEVVVTTTTTVTNVDLSEIVEQLKILNATLKAQPIQSETIETIETVYVPEPFVEETLEDEAEALVEEVIVTEKTYVEKAPRVKRYRHTAGRESTWFVLSGVLALIISVAALALLGLLRFYPESREWFGFEEVWSFLAGFDGEVRLAIYAGVVLSGFLGLVGSFRMFTAASGRVPRGEILLWGFIFLLGGLPISALLTFIGAAIYVKPSPALEPGYVPSTRMPRFLLGFSGVLAVFVSLGVIAVAGLLLFHEPSHAWFGFETLNTLLNDVQEYRDLILYVAAGFNLVTLIAAFRLIAATGGNVRRGEVALLGLINLISVSNFVTAVFAFAASVSHEVVLEEVVTSEDQGFVQVTKTIIEKPAPKESGSTFLTRLLTVLVVLFTIIIIIFVALVVLFMFEQTRTLPVVEDIYQWFLGLIGAS